MNFVMLANDWGAGVDNPTSKHRIALELARQGHRVLWVEGSGMRRPTVSGANAGGDRKRIARKLKKAFAGVRQETESIWSLGPLALPFPDKEWAYKFNNAFFLWKIKNACKHLKFERPALVNYVPTFDQLMHKWNGPCIYHCVDRWDAFDTYDSGLMQKRDAGCCNHADLVLATSADLVQRCKHHSDNVKMLSHGVDFEHFSQALNQSERPSDLPKGKIAGFFGLLSPWVDQVLLTSLAEQVPDNASVVLIGKADTDISALKNHPRIHCLGPKPFNELPQYIAHFSVGLIPFLVNELTKAVNPIKLREMMAAGCPVVTTDLPETYAYKELIDIVTSPDAFISKTIEHLANPVEQNKRQRLSEAVCNETWEAKVKTLVAEAEKLQKTSDLHS
jgi:glycosyltransferase involved in cell wall biosynthesis